MGCVIERLQDRSLLRILHGRNRRGFGDFRRDAENIGRSWHQAGGLHLCADRGGQKCVGLTIRLQARPGLRLPYQSDTIAPACLSRGVSHGIGPMPHVHKTPLWQITIPDAWTISGPDYFISMFRPDGVGMLRVETSDTVGRYDLLPYARDHSPEGTQFADVSCGPFRGVTVVR